MKTNHLLAGLSVLLFGGALWLAIAFLGADDASDVNAEAPLTPGAVAGVVPLDGEGKAEAPPVAKETRKAVVATAGPLNMTGPADSGGVIGRVIEEDGTPVAEISVALLQVDANLMLAADWAELGEPAPEIVLQRTNTDVDGRFRLEGAYDSSFQGLGIDMRGPRSTVRIVDTQLHHGEITDLGDIVLRGGCTVFGRVVDADGLPLAGARVRVVPMPPKAGIRDEDISMFLSVAPQDFRADCSVGVTSIALDTEGSPVVELPPLVRNHLDDLPIPTTHTDAEGLYRIEGLPVGELLLGADMPEWLGASRLVTTTPGDNQLEDSILTTGRTIFGVVVEEAGDPLEGIEVVVGSEFPFGEAAILHPAGLTDAQGRFSLTGLPDTGNAMACARRSPDEPWVGIVESPGQGLEIELPIAIAVTVHVVDEAGDPVRGATVKLAPTADQDSPMGMVGRFMGIGAAPREPRLAETEDGAYVCELLTPGKYEVTARPPGLAMSRQQVELFEEEAEVTIVCEAGLVIDLTVLDAATGAGVPGARASIVGAGFPLISALAVGRTGPGGRARLGPYSLKKDEAGFFGMSIMGGYQILVQHPRYADNSVAIEEGVSTAVVELVRGGEVHGQITWGEEPPLSIYMLVLQRTDRDEGIMQAFLPPRLGRSNLDGSFKFTNLPAGKYKLEVFDRFLDGDPILLIMGRKEPTLVHVVNDITLEPAGRADVEIDLSPSGRGQTARIAGSVHLDFDAVVGARVRVHGKGPGVNTETDGLGNFETPDFLALGEVTVQVTGDVKTESGEFENVTLHSETVTPEPQTVHRLDLDLRSTPLRVRVVSEGGMPLAGASVQLRAAGGYGRQQHAITNEAGEATLTLISTSRQAVQASAPDYASATMDFDPREASFRGEVEVVLRGAVSCAGLCDLSAFEGPGFGGDAYIWFSGPSEGGWIHLEADELEDDHRAPFRVEGLQPGTYQGHLWYGGRQAEELVIEIPEGGDENMYLVFEPLQQDD